MRSNVVKLRIRQRKRNAQVSAPPISLTQTRERLLGELPTPEVPQPREVTDAIEERAEALCREVLDLFREYLRRYAAYHAEVGHPRYLDIEVALQTIRDVTLDDAIAHRYAAKLRRIRRHLDIHLNMAEDYVAELDQALRAEEARQS